MVSKEESRDEALYVVVLNHEEMYSIWPADREIPAGWRAAEKRGKREDCLDYIESVWRDMRPLSVRRLVDPGHSGG